MLRQQSGKAWVNACGIMIECMTLTTVHFAVHRNFHFTFYFAQGGRKRVGGECCFFKREGERVCVWEREREGPLCPPETRKGIELICCCLVSAYGALSCTTVRGRGGEERAELTHYKLHHGHRRWAKGTLPSLRFLPWACRPQWSRAEEERREGEIEGGRGTERRAGWGGWPERRGGSQQ